MALRISHKALIIFGARQGRDRKRRWIVAAEETVHHRENCTGVFCRVRVISVGYRVLLQNAQNYSVGYRGSYRTHRTFLYCKSVIQNVQKRSGIVTAIHRTFL